MGNRTLQCTTGVCIFNEEDLLKLLTFVKTYFYIILSFPPCIFIYNFFIRLIQMTKVEDPQLTKCAYRKALRDSFIIHKPFFTALHLHL